MKIKFAFALGIVFFLLHATAFAATFSIASPAAAVKIGDTFTVHLVIDSEDKSINAAQTTVTFPKDILSIKSVDKTGSIFNFWLDEPLISNETGQLSFTAGSTNGFSGKSLDVLSVTFAVLSSGEGDIALSQSAITNADGTGANVLSKTYGMHVISAPVVGSAATLAITAEAPLAQPITKPVQITRVATAAVKTSQAPQVAVALYPDPTVWYGISANFSAKWNLPNDVTDVATAINHDPTFAPTQSEGLFDDKMFPAPDSGISYLHVRFRNNLGWGATAHYRLAVDTVPPLGFGLKIKEGDASDTPNPTILFTTGDQLSGIDHYDIAVDSQANNATTAASYQLPVLPPGDHAVTVTAWDKAGNSTSSALSINIIPIASPILGSVSKNIFVGEGNLFASGTANPTVSVITSIIDSKGQIVSTMTATPDENSFWSTNNDTPLKAGTYTIDVTARDARGALSLPVRETIKVSVRPLLTIFGIGITETWLFIVILIALVIAFIIGKISEKRRYERSGRRSFVLERDARNILASMQKEVSLIRKEKASMAVKEELDALDENIRKMDEYVVGDIENITK